MRRIHTDTEAWHGTVNGYDRHGCRCDECRMAACSAHDRSGLGWQDSLADLLADDHLGNLTSLTEGVFA